MKRITLSESPANKPPQQAVEYWLDDACTRDMDYFIKTLAAIKAKGVRPDLAGSFITHYASKWVPELSESRIVTTIEGNRTSSPESMITIWRKKRFLVETLVEILPLDNQAISCNFLLRLLRVANMLGVDPTYREELEKRVAWKLDQASLKELMIPSFSHTCGTLLDIELVRRLVKRFMAMDESARSGVAMVKVAKLLDCYLAEVAVDSKLSLEEFIELACALPPHARATDDGLYRAIDTYLKAHPGMTKKERKFLCRSMDTQKLSPEASLHAIQNERLPIRVVTQVLYSEQNRINKQLDLSGPMGYGSGLRSPSAIELSARCHSKREISNRQTEIKRLKEDVVRLQKQINCLQYQLERLLVEKKKGMFKWRRFTTLPGFRSGNESRRSDGIEEFGFGRHTPIPVDHLKTKLVKPNNKVLPKWRRSLS